MRILTSGLAADISGAGSPAGLHATPLLFNSYVSHKHARCNSRQFLRPATGFDPRHVPERSPWG